MSRAPADPDPVPGSNRFPSTVWAQFLDTRTDRGLTHLAERYWKPIFAFIRARHAKSADEAFDLTQEFFVRMMESDFTDRADPVRGRFRAYVKAALRNFLSVEARDRNRLKRGGGKKIVSINAGNFDPLEPSDPAAANPEEALDNAWKREIIHRARGRLDADLRAAGKAVYADVFREYYLDQSEEVDYEALAARHGISRTDVSNYLTHAKRVFREILTDLVAETVNGPEDLREELRSLFGGAGPP